MLPKKFRTFLVCCQDNQSLALIALALLAVVVVVLTAVIRVPNPNIVGLLYLRVFLVEVVVVLVLVEGAQ